MTAAEPALPRDPSAPDTPDTPADPVAPGLHSGAKGAPGVQATDDAVAPAFTVGYVPGVMPGKWLGRWRDRQLTPLLRDELVPAGQWREVLQDGTVTACFVRLGWSPTDPNLEELRATHHAVHLYDELQVAVLPTEDLLSVLDTLTTVQLREESTPQPHADIDDAAMGVELAAAGVGPVVLPMSVARLHARKDVTTRELTDAPTLPVVLVWPKSVDEATEDAVQRFVGIVRGRKESSGRDDAVPPRRAASSAKDEGRGAETAVEKTPEKQRGGKAQSGGWAKAGASTKPGLRRKPGRKVKNGRNKKRR
ncbi:hypothetical protein EAE32_04635 [Kocuria tytonicola]|uniref:Uncharacterized protein n=1 Tax=Kocuria tytonicola TaxID=2055946 RepID=A0A3L9L8I5_9MICC|nr:LysR substrate-binding domain-containing protein [Kocuria tytonicola]RLY94474.1 hypothetical protein EAE32_04635 [Kocuria tytonicola]